VLVPIYLGEIQFISITVNGVQVLCITCTELPEKCSSITNVYISLLISLVVSYPDNSYHRRTYKWVSVSVRFMVFNAIFNNISLISWRSVLLVEKIGGPRRKPVTSHTMLYTSPWSRFELTSSVVIGTDCIDSCKVNLTTIRSWPWRPTKI